MLTLLLTRLQSPDCCSLTVDFYDVAYIDTSGLAILVQALKAARSYGKAFHLSGLPGAAVLSIRNDTASAFFEKRKAKCNRWTLIPRILDEHARC